MQQWASYKGMVVFWEVVALDVSTTLWMRTWIGMVKEVMARLWQLPHHIPGIQVRIIHTSVKMCFYCSFALLFSIVFLFVFRKDFIYFFCTMSVYSSMSNIMPTAYALCLFARTDQNFILISSQTQFALRRNCEPGHLLKTAKSSNICTTNEAL